MHLRIDTINPTKTRGLTTDLRKIDLNLKLLPAIEKSIAKLKESSKEAFTTLSVYGRWLVVYQANVSDEEDTMMHFIDFRIELDDVENLQIFSEKTLDALISLQDKYDQVYSDSMNTVELSFAEPEEKILENNFFACEEDPVVLAIAKKLGAEPMLHSTLQKEGVRIVIADEQKMVDGNEITNAYALIHFIDADDSSENGYAYFKIYDIKDNSHLIGDFVDTLQKIGGEFDRAFFMKRFDISQLN